jgi:sugar-specific transcriptional regulator TrmB
MSLNTDDALVLNRLGLTPAQAKIYLSLLRFEKVTAKAIAQEARMDRAETYRIIRALEERGFVERIISHPCEFKAATLSAVIKDLLEKRKNELRTAEGEANLLLNKENYNRITNNKENDIIIIVPRPELIEEKIVEWFSKYESSFELIDTLLSIGEFDRITEKAVWGALERGVKVTFITEKPSRRNPVPSVIKRLLKSPNFTLRNTLGVPNNRILIEDGKKAWVCLEKKTFFHQSKQLACSNPCLVSLILDYYNFVKASSVKYKVNQSMKSQHQVLK